MSLYVRQAEPTDTPTMICLVAVALGVLAFSLLKRVVGWHDQVGKRTLLHS